ncbi:hypothetical protein ACT4S5_13165 [Kocuria oceani]|uniref:hypothetical protein n=1 Tax=Kocuria oceani TaxID=988827 RepID=UPI004035534E
MSVLRDTVLVQQFDDVGLGEPPDHGQPIDQGREVGRPRGKQIGLDQHLPGHAQLRVVRVAQSRGGRGVRGPAGLHRARCDTSFLGVASGLPGAAGGASLGLALVGACVLLLVADRLRHRHRVVDRGGVGGVDEPIDPHLGQRLGQRVDDPSTLQQPPGVVEIELQGVGDPPVQVLEHWIVSPRVGLLFEHGAEHVAGDGQLLLAGEPRLDHRRGGRALPAG